MNVGWLLVITAENSYAWRRNLLLQWVGGAGKEVMEYMGPQPPTGIHRYVFVAFKQNSLMETVRRRPVERGQFNTRQFASENDLGLPAAALYFNSQKQPAGNKKH